MEGTLKVTEKGLETAGNPTTSNKKRGEGGLERPVPQLEKQKWPKTKKMREKSEKYQGGKVFTWVMSNVVWYFWELFFFQITLTMASVYIATLAYSENAHIYCGSFIRTDGCIDAILVKVCTVTMHTSVCSIKSVHCHSTHSPCTLLEKKVFLVPTRRLHRKPGGIDSSHFLALKNNPYLFKAKCVHCVHCHF